MNFCVYEHWRPDKNACFYVGKGTRKRAQAISRKENERHRRVVAKLRRLGLTVEVRIFAADVTEEEAFRIEVARIAALRADGIDLVNMTDGGEGSVGAVRSDEFKTHLSRVMTGRRVQRLPTSEAHKQAISASLTGRVLSDETKAKISAAQKGRARPDMIGRKLSPEGIDRLRSRVFTEEHRAKISAAKRGRSPSPEHRAKLSAALRAHHASRR